MSESLTSKEHLIRRLSIFIEGADGPYGEKVKDYPLTNLLRDVRTHLQSLAETKADPSFDIDEVDFIWNEMYASISNGADDPMFQRIEDKAMNIKRAHNAKRRAQKTETARLPVIVPESILAQAENPAGCGQ